MPRKNGSGGYKFMEWAQRRESDTIAAVMMQAKSLEARIRDKI